MEDKFFISLTTLMLFFLITFFCLMLILTFKDFFLIEFILNDLIKLCFLKEFLC